MLATGCRGCDIPARQNCATDRLVLIELSPARTDPDPTAMWDQCGDLSMGLLLTYIACLVVGQSITIAIGLSIDRFYSSAVSLPISLALYFLMFGIAWKVAVRITEPKAEKTPPPAG
jgi:hypothetical protein